MRIVIDFCHPAHVHYFKYFIQALQKKGHEFLFFARDRYPIHELLEHYGISYINRGKGANSLLGKLLYIPKAIWVIYKHARKFKPDLFLDYGDFYTAFTAFILRSKYIALDDTESGWKVRALHMPFTEVILTPDSFKFDLGRKQIRYPGTIELAYVHPRVFSPDPDVFRALELVPGSKFALLRFVSWDAHHDIGLSGLTNENKVKLVKELSRYLKVYISSEGELPLELQMYQIQISPHQMHDVLYYAHFLIGESATMASEAGILGTKAIYINRHQLGYLDEQARHGLIQTFSDSPEDQHKALAKAMEFAQDDGLKLQAARERNVMLENMIDVTAFLCWFVDDYPNSVDQMRGKDFDFGMFK